MVHEPVSPVHECLQRHQLKTLGADGPPLLFGPSLFHSTAVWEPVARAFEATHRVALFEFAAGQPASDPPGEAPHYDDLWGHATDLVELLGALDAPPVDYVGHGMGGIAGVLAGALAPRLFRRIVLLNATPRFLNHPSGYKGGFTREHVDAVLELLGQDLDAFSDTMVALAFGPGAGDEARRRTTARLAGYDRAALVEAMRAMFLADHRADLAGCRVPVTVLHARDNAYVPDAATDYLLQSLPRVQAQPLDAPGHCPHISHPEAVVAALREILARPL